MDFHRTVRYALAGRHRPYLRVVFFNKKINSASAFTFALVDSGADDIIIPYSVGINIGLKAASDFEFGESSKRTGIGGDINVVMRACQVRIVDDETKQLLVFNEDVHWMHPSLRIQEEINVLQKRIEELRAARISEPNLKSGLNEIIRAEMELATRKLQDINDTFEKDPILGRPFFDNFDFITFYHRDRKKEDECFFEYRIKPEKFVEKLSIA